MNSCKIRINLQFYILFLPSSFCSNFVPTHFDHYMCNKSNKIYGIEDYKILAIELVRECIVLYNIVQF